MTTPATENGPITFVNAFEIDHEQLDAFLVGWRERAEFMSKQPGFRSLRLLRALSADTRFQLINVAQWDSADAHRAATAHDFFIASTGRAVDDLDVTPNPGYYRVAIEVTARS